MNRYLEADRAARPETWPLTKDQLGAAKFIERAYAAADASGYTSRLALWIDPKTAPKIRDAILGLAYRSDEMEGGLSAFDRRRYYRLATEAVMPAVESAARTWALAALENQERKLHALWLVTDHQAKRLHDAADKARAAVSAGVYLSTRTTTAEQLEITGQSGGSGTMTVRLERVSYMSAVKAGGDKDLLKLMAHPRGVKIVKAFAASADTGRTYACETIDECRAAIAEVRADLASDETLVWRFPPAIRAGVSILGLASLPGLTGFSLGWATVQDQTLSNQALDIAGNAIFALELLGGPFGVAFAEILDFVLAVIGTAVSFVHDVEQDQAAHATAFADDAEKLSEGSRGLGTILQGAAAIVAALALPAAVSRIAQRAGKTAELVTAIKHVPPAKVPDPRGVSRPGFEAEAVTATDRGIAGVGTELAPPGVGSKIDTAPLKASGEVRTIREEAPTPGVSKQERLTSERGTQATNAAPTRPIVPPELISTNVHLSGDTANSGGITRIWAHREPDGTLAFRIDGEVGDALPRPHPNTPDFNREPPPGSMIGLPDYEIAHLWGPGFGDEARDGMMYAPREMNQVFQNRFIESRLRELHTLARRQGATIKLTASARSYPLKTWRGHEMLKEVSYDFQVRLADGTTLQIGRVEITVPPPRSTDRFTVQVVPGSAAAWSLL